MNNDTAYNTLDQSQDNIAGRVEDMTLDTELPPTKAPIKEKTLTERLLEWRKMKIKEGDKFFTKQESEPNLSVIE
jgi:hypothetical protein